MAKKRDQQQIEFAFMTWPICTVCVSYQAAATALRLARFSPLLPIFCAHFPCRLLVPPPIFGRQICRVLDLGKLCH